jgi:copper transport protein
VAVAVLAVASVLVTTPPGVVVSAAEAAANDPAATSGPVVESLVLEEDELMVQVVVDPARVGANQVAVTVTDLAFAPLDVPEVQASLVLPEQELGPLPVALTRIGPGEYEATAAQLPTAGQWRLDIAVRTSEIERHTLPVDVPVP